MPPKESPLQYGFFAVMGGIAVNVSKLMDDEELLRLSPKAIIFLTSERTFVDIPSATISDKSKASLLGKALDCMKVIWFIAQCVARKAAGYSLVLLEIHTMVHMIRTLLMYAFWWKVSPKILEEIYNSF